MAYEYTTVDALATDPEGRPWGVVPIRVPTELPSEDRAETLRRLYDAHVQPTGPDRHWKGPCEAVVPAAMADDVAEAMEFMGSIVDEREAAPGGLVRLASRGYWAHGF